MKKLVVLTGAGVSAESGISTFRDNGGLWDNYDPQQVASIEGWYQNPGLMIDFYNIRRHELEGVRPNDAHRAIASLQDNFNVNVITQNVDNLHERAGSSHVIHLHGELMKMCSCHDVDNPRFHITLPKEGFGETGLEVPHGAKAEDGSLLRPFIVFFGENVPNMYDAALEAQEADIFIIIGTSLNVYPAAGLVRYAKPDTPVYIIDPKPVTARQNMIQIQAGASEGMRQLIAMLKGK